MKQGARWRVRAPSAAPDAAFVKATGRDPAREQRSDLRGAAAAQAPATAPAPWPRESGPSSLWSGCLVATLPLMNKKFAAGCCESAGWALHTSALRRKDKRFLALQRARPRGCSE